ncbi:MAG: M20/M25/M40 family metallo-hydrolase [Planctomycetota bacterium]|nr:MAG: M20/M25/M40 family metallo-hydrolase [Planctomycetota bacterium]
MKSLRLLRLLALGAGSLVLSPQTLPAIEAEARNAAAAAITESDVKHHVDVLADDTFEGREAGTRGNRAAGIYLVKRFEELGISPGGPEGSYYQQGNGISNILALVPGGDPDLRDEVIVIGAHYDHVGYGTRRNSYGPVGYIHNGADDNASGVAALMEIADAVSHLPEKPRRSILFALWDGEEKGLLGSKYWVNHPTVPLKNVRVAINVDMIGRLRKSKLQVYGIRTLPGSRQLVSRQNVDGLLLDFNWDMRGDSDHYSFYSRGIPVLMLHTGLHDDYHRPSDDVERINSEGLKDISRLMFAVLIELADAPNLSRFRSQSRLESESIKRRIEVSLPPPPGRLGIRWQEQAAQDGKIVVEQVTSGSAADKGGLESGDRIVTFDGLEVSDPDAFRLAVLGAENPVPVTVERPGEDDPVELELELRGDPVRLGISWRVDSAEPGAVIVNRLIPGSPAAMAGLRAGDRVIGIGGRQFSDGDEFHELAHSLPDPVVLEVETDGRVRLVDIPPLPKRDEK